ncbi:MAG: hypothetical protein K2N55_07465, partial [Lachnospiraceae bacterium]|nr:hypothetical protein [Lachnospiraceae bacterium]
MKRQMICGVCILTSLMTLGKPMDTFATELSGEKTITAFDDTEELLTAGAGDLFLSSLTKVEYLEIARNAEGAL